MRVFAIWAMALLATPVMADGGPIVHLDNPASVVSTLQEEGFRAKLSKDSKDRPYIDTGIGGLIFTIKFFGCKNGIDCHSLLFSALFDLDGGFELKRINEWNADALMGRAYLDDECDPVIDHYIYIGRDRQIGHFTRELENWGASLEDFRKFIGFDKDEPASIVTCNGDPVI